MKPILIASVLLASLSVAPAWAEDMRAQANRMQAILGELGTNKKQMDDYTAKNEAEMKVYDAMFGNMKQLEQQKQAKRAAFINQVANPLRLKANGIVNAWNAACAGEHPQAVYDACEIRKAADQKQVDALRQSVKGKEAEFEKREIQPLNKIQQRQQQGLDQMSAHIKQRYGYWQELRTRNAALITELQRIRDRFRADCSGDTPEALKYCPAIVWDGAEQGLKPLPEWIEKEWGWAQQHPDRPSTVITPKELQQ